MNINNIFWPTVLAERLPHCYTSSPMHFCAADRRKYYQPAPKSRRHRRTGPKRLVLIPAPYRPGPGMPF